MSEQAKNLLSVLGLIAAGLFWLFTVNGLPPRVDKLEEQVKLHESKLTRNDVKLDIMLEDVKTIKNILMQLRTR